MKGIVYLVISISIFNQSLWAQERDSLIQLNPGIGDTLTLEERNYYKLFPKIDGFQWAVFYLNPDSSVSTKITYIENNKTKDTLVVLSSSLNKLQQYIYDTELSKSVINDNGAEVSAQLSNGGMISGNLLSVRKTSLLIYNSNKRITDNEFDYKFVYNVKQRDIDKLTIKGQSNVLKGMGIGLLAGIGLGVLVGYAVYGGDSGQTFADIGRAQEAGMIGLAVGIGCLLTGTLWGISTSTSDEVIEQFSGYDITGLSSYSKYPIKEPYELKKIE
ncbi:MAG: hypothetical protein JSW63_12835 [Ignavibacterium sp.]|nr:MAG: hypothetical protein JSW63_12835 [Ignavibacterium sp.]